MKQKRERTQMECFHCHATTMQRVWKSIPLRRQRIRIMACLKCSRLYQTIERYDEVQQVEFAFGSQRARRRKV